jgi:hypothetical protein
MRATDNPPQLKIIEISVVDTFSRQNLAIKFRLMVDTFDLNYANFSYLLFSFKGILTYGLKLLPKLILILLYLFEHVTL